MLKTNLSTRPFYDEGPVRLGLAGAAILVVLFTVFNVTRVIQLSRSDTKLATQAASAETRSEELRTTAARLRSSVDPKAIELASSEAHLANNLIDRRTFSWTELFNRFEATLPDEARITSVRPTIDRKRGIILGVTVVARGVDDVNRFMENLEATGAFAHPFTHDETVTEQGLVEAALEMTYRPGGKEGRAQ